MTARGSASPRPVAFTSRSGAARDTEGATPPPTRGRGADASGAPRPDTARVPELLPRPHEMGEPALYAVEWDLAQLVHDCKRCDGRGTVAVVLSSKRKRCARCHGRGRGLAGFAKRHLPELEQWWRELGISPTLGAVLALGMFFHGLPGARAHRDHRRRLGRGLQVPTRFLSLLLGVHRSNVSEALREGQRRGLLKRYHPTRAVSAITRGRLDKASVKARKGGREDRSTINVHGILYVTAKGVELLRGAGAGGVGSARLRAAVPVDKSGGLVGFLLTALGPVLRAVAGRCASQEVGGTPYGGDVDRNIEESSSTVVASYGGERLKAGSGGSDPPGGPNSGPPASAGGLPLRVQVALGRASPPGRGWPRTLDALTRLELAELFGHVAGPHEAWPELWSTGDPHARRWLASEWERHRARADGRAWTASRRPRGKPS